MPTRAPPFRSVSASLSALQTGLRMLRSTTVLAPTIAIAIDRVSSDLAATDFHLSRGAKSQWPVIVAVLGGTGTGKSTLVNRLLDASDHPITAASFRRTFTAGPVAVVHPSNDPPERWLAIDHVSHDDTSAPARGTADVLTVIRRDLDLLKQITLIDTPDLDGDQPAHHAQADRVFRWSDAAIFLVTPEKYQMTELLPYYQLARRYGVPCVFVMNKTEEQAAVDDYSHQLTRNSASSPRVFAVARDGSGFAPHQDMDLSAVRAALPSLATSDPEARQSGISQRISDVLNRVRDQIIDPLRTRRREVDRAIASLRAMESPSPDVDVSLLMIQLRRRLQQRSVLYLMGPGRMLDRVRQVPGLLARLPRTAWDLMRHGQIGSSNGDELPGGGNDSKLDFHQILADQMRVVQARIQDIVGVNTSDLQSSLIDPEDAGKIADEELAALREWLTKKWNATPRDTALITKLVRHLPGGEKLARWSEAAPYLLAIAVATHHAFFGPIDLMVIGGWSLATWVSEKLSNEVSWQARETNAAINRRFAQLAHQQIARVNAWLDKQTPTTRSLDELQRIADRTS